MLDVHGARGHRGRYFLLYRGLGVANSDLVQVRHRLSRLVLTGTVLLLAGFNPSRASSAPSPIVPGAYETAAFDPDGRGQTRAFAGSAGQILLFDALDVGESAAVVALLDPEGNPTPVVGSAFSDLGPFVLKRAGTNYLAFDAPTGGVTSLQFRLLDCAAGVPLVAGVETSGLLKGPREANVYRFDAVAGQRFALEPIAVGAGQALWTLYSPSGARLVESPLEYNMGEQRLLVSGTFYLVVRPVEAPGGLGGDIQYSFRLVLANDPAVSLEAPTIISGWLQGAGGITNTIRAPAGTALVLDSQVSGTNIVVNLWFGGQALWGRYPAGADLGDGGPRPFVRPYIMPGSGNYTVVIRAASGSAGGAYRLRPLVTPRDAPLIALGAEQSGGVEPNGLKMFRFTGTPGQRLYYDALVDAAVAGGMRMWLVAPSGAVVLGDTGEGVPQSAAIDAGPGTVVESGVHYLMLSNGAGAANYRFRLLDAAVADTLSMGQVVGGAGPDAPTLAAHAARVFRFDGPVGQRLYLDSLNPAAAGATWTLVEADDAGRVELLTNDFEATLRTVGMRVVVLGNNSGVPVPYGLRIVEFASTTEPMPEGGALVSGTLGTLGSEARFTFTAEAGERLYYDGVSASHSGVQIGLEGPGGVVVIGTTNATADIGPFSAGAVGLYTLTVKNFGDTAGAFEFRLLRVAAAPALSLNVPVEGRVEAHQVGLYRIEAQPGLFVGARASLAPAEAVWAWFDSADAAVLGERFMAADLGPLEWTGIDAHLIVIRNPGASGGDYRFEVSSNRPPSLGDAAPEAIEETLLEFSLPGADADVGDSLTYSIESGAPEGLTLDPVSGVISWVPSEAQGPGEYAVEVRVTDSGIPSLSASRVYVIRVAEGNRAPVAQAMGDRTLGSGQSLELAVPAVDPDVPAQGLRFTLISGPPGMTLDPDTGVLRYEAGVAPLAAVFEVVVGVADTFDPPAEVQTAFTLTVSPMEPAALWIEVQDGSVRLSWSSSEGVRYRVEFCASLPSQVWEDIGPDIMGLPSMTSVTEPLPEGAACRFYRVLAFDE